VAYDLYKWADAINEIPARDHYVPAPMFGHALNLALALMVACLIALALWRLR
jgi:hypothetical protein